MAHVVRSSLSGLSSQHLKPFNHGENLLPRPNQNKSIRGGNFNLSVRASVDDRPENPTTISRNSLIRLLPLSSFASLISDGPALGITTTAFAGRVPGLSEADSDGKRTYRRPEKKSGGHGIGWSEFTPYSFKVSENWEEVPVSIADLGGTEIDLRFSNPSEGNISVVVAPVLRFNDRLGENARIESIGTPEKVIYAFGPEITGASVEGKVKSMDVKEVDGLKYYQYELNPHILVSVTASGTRLYIMTVSSNSRQWKKYSSNLKDILDSFRIG